MDILPRKETKGECLQIMHVEGGRCYIRWLAKCPAHFSVTGIALHFPSDANVAADFKADAGGGRGCHHAPVMDTAMQEH